MAKLAKTGPAHIAQQSTGCYKYGRIIHEARAVARESSQYGTRKPAPTQPIRLYVRRRPGAPDLYTHATINKAPWTA